MLHMYRYVLTWLVFCKLPCTKKNKKNNSVPNVLSRTSGRFLKKFLLIVVQCRIAGCSSYLYLCQKNKINKKQKMYILKVRSDTD